MIINLSNLSLGRFSDCRHCCSVQVLFMLVLVMLWSFHFLLSRVAVLAGMHLQHQSWIICVNTAQGDKFDLFKWCLFWSLRDLRQDKWLLDRRFRCICVRGPVVTNSCVDSGKVWITLTLPVFFHPPLLLKRHCAFKLKWLYRLQEKRGKEPKKRRMVYEQEGGGRAGRGKKGRFSMFQTRSRRRFWEEPEESSLLLPSIPFQLCFPPPSSSLSLLWVYPSGSFSPISPPAVLGTLDCCLSPISHTVFLLSLSPIRSLTHTHSLPLTHTFLLTFSSMSCSPYRYFKMFLISLPVLKSTTRYLSVYPLLTSIYSLNPSTWRSTVSLLIPLIASCFLTDSSGFLSTFHPCFFPFSPTHSCSLDGMPSSGTSPTLRFHLSPHIWPPAPPLCS